MCQLDQSAVDIRTSKRIHWNEEGTKPSSSEKGDGGADMFGSWVRQLNWKTDLVLSIPKNVIM
jgi:hypothetical protein